MLALIEAAKQSRRPEYARAMFVAATTGVRRAELCALRRQRDVDWDHAVLSVSCSIVNLAGQPIREIPTKNRQTRRVALDTTTLSMLQAQVDMLTARAAVAGVALDADAYLFSDAADGSAPWKPGAVTQYFAKLRKRIDLDHLDFHYLRKFMETYGQDLGFSPAAVAMLAGHDPSVASKHYTGKIAAADRALASAVASLLVPSP